MHKAVTCALVLLAGWSIASGTGAAAGLFQEETTGSPILERFLNQVETPLHSYRAVRRLSATNRRYGVSGWLEASTELHPVNGLTYEIVAEGGSGYIRNKVLRKIIEREFEAAKAGDADRAALTLDNYEFGEAEAGDGEVRIRILPRRRELLLVSGAIVLTPHDGELLRVEGDLAKAPSFWTRRVFVVRRYGRVNTIRVPLEMLSTAEVRIVGDASFTMCWDYEIVNGVPVVPRISCS